jgi:hypothetical protein
MSIVRSIAAVVLVAVTALHSAPVRAKAPAAVPVPITLTDAQRVEIERGVRDQLGESPAPDQFSGIAAVDVLKDHPQMFIVACGFVYVRNGFGGYTGKTLFSAYLREGKAGGVQVSDGVELVKTCMIKYGVRLHAAD